MEKEYLGDGVYVEVQHGMIRLSVNDGYTDTNSIFLEQDVMEKLISYYRKEKGEETNEI